MKLSYQSFEQQREVLSTPQFWDHLYQGGLDTQQRIVHLAAFLSSGGSLSDPISQYRRNCDASQARAIQWMIVEYLSALMPGGVIDPRADTMDKIRTLNRDGLTELFACELRKRVRRTSSGGWTIVPLRSQRIPSLKQIASLGEYTCNGGEHHWSQTAAGLWAA